MLVIGTDDYCYDLEKTLRPAPDIGWNIAPGGGRPAESTILAGAERFRILNSQRFGDNNPAKCPKVRAKISQKNSDGRTANWGSANPWFGVGPANGKAWYHSPDTNEEMYFDEGDEPVGWVRGRKHSSANKGQCWYHSLEENKTGFFIEGMQPEGWLKGSNISSIKGKSPYHCPETHKTRYFIEGTQPQGWLKGKFNYKTPTQGKRWYHNSINNEENCFIEGNQPEGWIKGRKKKR